MQIIQYLKNYLEVHREGTAGVLNKKIKILKRKKKYFTPNE